MFSTILAKNLSDTGVVVHSLHPGAVNTELQRYATFDKNFIMNLLKKLTLLNPTAGSLTSVKLALSPEFENVSGNTTDPSAAKPDGFAIGSISKRDRSGSGDEATPVYPVKHPTMSYAGAAKGRPAAQTVDESIYHWYTGGEKQKLKKLCMGGSECKIGCSWDQFGDNASDAVESICRQLFDLRMTMQHDRP
ncbi:hypothetical protein BB560_005101, partial [Smittium megazygosporum]